METEIIAHSYDWNVKKDAETGKSIIHCWALDKQSKPHLLRIHEFDAFCYIELPMFLNNSLVKWQGFRERLIYDAICYKLGDDSPHRYMYVEREKYYYYKGKNKKYPMLLLCFHSVEAMNTCKNKLKFAFKIRGLKGGDDETMISLRVWETHIPLERKLLTLRNCKYSQWFSIKGVKVLGNDKISTLDNEFVVDWKSLNPISEEETVRWITHPKILSFDLETYSDRHNAMPDSLCSKHVIYLVSVVTQRLFEPETRKKQIILFGECSDTDLADVIKVKTEDDLIDTLQDLINIHDPEIITGYNIVGYDNPYLDNRLKRKLKDWKPLGRIIGEKTEMSSISWSSSAYKNQEFNILEMSGRISIDLLPAVKRDHKLPLYKLDYVANHFLGKGKHDVSAKQMFETFELQKSQYNSDDEKKYALDEMRKVVDYCVVDSDLVVDLFEKLNVWIGLISLSNIMGITPSFIFTRGTGVRMQSQIYDEASRSGIVLDEVDFDKVDFVGGYVAEPKVGIHKYIPIFDFKSLYPSVQISHNMDHSTLVPDHLMDSIPDEDCHVIEWEGEEEEGEEEEEEEEENDNDDEEKEKKIVKKTVKKAIKYKRKFVKEPIGIMPRLLVRLIAERNKVRKKQKDLPKDSLEWTVLEQTQLGIKCSSNAFFGSCGSNFGKLRCPPIAAAITAKARESTKKMNKYLEDRGHHIIYGDSVTGDTPILIFRNGIREYINIEDLTKNFDTSNEKHYSVPTINLKIWSDQGFTDIKYIMRHKTKKRIFVIVTTSGIVKVTEDHSLLNGEGMEVSPKNVKIGDILMTKEHPLEMREKGIVKQATITCLSALDAMVTTNRLKTYGYNISYDYFDGKYKIMIKEENNNTKGEILKIIDLGLIDDYVYDLETENHHFSAGVGELVVHNTDSTMPDLGITDPKTAWQIGEKFSKELTSLYIKPMEIEQECVVFTMLSIKKKMYACIYMDEKGNPIDDPDKMKIRGITLARRDNCAFQRNLYKDILWKVMHKDKNPFNDVFNYIIDKCIELASHCVVWEDLTIIKGLGAHYKSKSYMMKVFSDEMTKSGNPMAAGDRIPYLIVKGEVEDQLVGYKMRTKELFLERAESDNPEHIDYIYYLEKIIRNGIEKQLFQVGYKDEIAELQKKYNEIDEDRVILELRKLGYGTIVDNLLTKSTKKEAIEYLRDHDKMGKVMKPLYSYFIRRRKGRGRRLSSRINGEPILMITRIMRAKAEVMKQVKSHQKKTKKIILKIIK